MLLLLLLVCLICWFIGLFMSCALLKSELSLRVVLDSAFFLVFFCFVFFLSFLL